MNAKAIDRLASALGRADEAPNVALARELAAAAWEELLLMLARGGGEPGPMYAEAALAEVVRAWLAESAQPAKKARLEKVLRRLAKV